MKVIGFYTVGDGSSYEEEAELWARSLECVGMPLAQLQRTVP